jgi:hypothetical protein
MLHSIQIALQQYKARNLCFKHAVKVLQNTASWHSFLHKK